MQFSCSAKKSFSYTPRTRSQRCVIDDLLLWKVDEEAIVPFNFFPAMGVKFRGYREQASKVREFEGAVRCSLNAGTQVL